MSRVKAVDALEVLNRKDAGDQEMHALLLQAYIGSQLAQWVYNVRMRAQLSQRQLAERIGSSQPAIARLEDSDYTGHSLKVVTRIAVALDEPLVIDVDPRRRHGRKRTGSGKAGYATRIAEGGRRPAAKRGRSKASGRRRSPG